MKIKGKYKELMDELANEFVELTERDGLWNNDYTLYVTEYEAWVVEDMLYIVTNIDQLKKWYRSLDGVREQISLWIDYNVDVGSLGIAYINLKSWMMGCPRMSEKEREKVRKAKKALDDIIHDMVNTYGKVDNNPQPEHLRSIGNGVHDS